MAHIMVIFTGFLRSVRIGTHAVCRLGLGAVTVKLVKLLLAYRDDTVTLAGSSLQLFERQEVKLFSSQA